MIWFNWDKNQCFYYQGWVYPENSLGWFSILSRVENTPLSVPGAERTSLQGVLQSTVTGVYTHTTRNNNKDPGPSCYTGNNLTLQQFVLGGGGCIKSEMVGILGIKPVKFELC